MTEFICLDVETTGLDKTQDSLIEFAAVRFNGSEIIDQYQTLIHFDGEIPEIVQHLTGINKEMLVDAPKLDEVKDKIMEFVGDLPILGHNIQFDIGFLHKGGMPVPGQIIDTLPLSQILLDSPSYSLETLCRKHNVDYFPSHRALDDVLANVELFWFMLNKISFLSPEQAWLWNKIGTESGLKIADIISEFLPEKQKEPTFPDIREELHTPSPKNNEPATINILNDIDLEKFGDSGNDVLIVSNEHTERFNHLPAYASLISSELFLEEIKDITYEKYFFLLKVATKITEKFPLYRSDIKFIGEDYNIVDKIICEDYLYHKTDDPFLTNHFTFFKLLQHSLLPDVEEVHFENVPFLEETYIRAQEKNITIHAAEGGSEDLTVSFGKIGMYLNKLAEGKELYGPMLLDPLEAASQEFREFLDTVIEKSPNKEIQDDCKDLLSNANQYVIWARLRDDSPPAIGFIDRDTKYNLESILKESGVPKTNVYHPTSEDNLFYMDVDSNIPEPKSPGYPRAIKTEIEQMFTGLTGHGLVICTSNAQIMEIHKTMANDFQEQGISMLSQNISGSKGKILDNIENEDNPIILVCTQHFYLRFRPHLTKLKGVILARLPMTLPSHPFYEFLKSHTQNSFTELTLPHSAAVLYQICNRISEQSDLESLQLMDHRIATTDLGMRIQDSLPRSVVVRGM